MKPYSYTKILFLFLLFALCTPALCTPAKSKRPDTASIQASQRKQEKKQILSYYIRVCRLTDRIRNVQSIESGLLLHPSYWSYPVWSKKMRLQVDYMHTLKEEAKSLKPPPACQAVNQDLVASLTLLETAFLKTYQAQTAPIRERAKAEVFAAASGKAAAKSQAFERKFLAALGGIQTRYHLPDTYQFTDWPTTAM